MALTRKMLEDMGIEKENIEAIISANAESVDALKHQRDAYKADAEKLASVQAELDSLKGNESGYKAKYDKLNDEYKAYKDGIVKKETKAAKEAAVKEYYTSKGIPAKNLDLAIRASSAEIDAVEVADGKIKDTSALDGLVGGYLSSLVAVQQRTGTQTENPTGTSGGSMTKAEIMAIKDTAKRQKAIAENLELFGKGE